jgi:hypothetical protein
MQRPDSIRRSRADPPHGPEPLPTVTLHPIEDGRVAGSLASVGESCPLLNAIGVMGEGAPEPGPHRPTGSPPAPIQSKSYARSTIGESEGHQDDRTTHARGPHHMHVELPILEPYRPLLACVSALEPLEVVPKQVESLLF